MGPDIIDEEYNGPVLAFEHQLTFSRLGTPVHPPRKQRETVLWKVIMGSDGLVVRGLLRDY